MRASAIGTSRANRGKGPSRVNGAPRANQVVATRRLALLGAVLLFVGIALALVVRNHPAPLPGDVGAELAVQHALLARGPLTALVEGVSTINFPVPSALLVATVAALLLVVRRWLDLLVTLLVAALADGSSALIKGLVQRSRPSGYGIQVLQHILNSPSYPSGHVLHATAVFGILLFLTYQVRRPAAWVWAARAVLIALIVLMGPSRMLEGEHWLSDVVGGLLYGAFWLVLGIIVYRWARRRYPRLSAYIEPDATLAA